MIEEPSACRLVRPISTCTRNASCGQSRNRVWINWSPLGSGRSGESFTNSSTNIITNATIKAWQSFALPRRDDGSRRRADCVSCAAGWTVELLSPTRRRERRRVHPSPDRRPHRKGHASADWPSIESWAIDSPTCEEARDAEWSRLRRRHSCREPNPGQTTLRPRSPAAVEPQLETAPRRRSSGWNTTGSPCGRAVNTACGVRDGRYLRKRTQRR